MYIIFIDAVPTTFNTAMTNNDKYNKKFAFQFLQFRGIII